MYAALGDSAAARAAFAETARPDVVCTTAMVGALAAGGDVGSRRVERHDSGVRARGQVE
jgi:hypothetical protein